MQKIKIIKEPAEYTKTQERQYFKDKSKEPFDYTKWQEDLYEDMSIEELSKKAMNFVNSKKL